MNTRPWAAFAAALCFVLTLATPVLAQPGGPNACTLPAPCGDTCSNQPYVETSCWTTQYGPAAADLVLVFGEGPPTQSPNMLECPSGPYALCFYSGPTEKTGTNPNNKVLPCVLDESGTTAKCTCAYFSSGTNYVDINGILNLNAWYETIQACGKFGEHCRNIKNSKLCVNSSPTEGDCKIAPVCKYVREQSPTDAAKSLVPGATTISDFSLALAADYNMKKVTSCASGKYAGCMTAACGKPTAGGLVECSCPVVEGPFQIGQVQPDGSPYPCDLGSNLVWSASYTVNLEKPASP